MPAVLVTGPTVTQNSLILSLWWWLKPSSVTYSIIEYHRGMARLS